MSQPDEKTDRRNDDNKSMRPYSHTSSLDSSIPRCSNSKHRSGTGPQYVNPFLLMFIAIGLSACSSLISDVPPVADSTMVNVLVELHLANARTELQSDLVPALRDSILADNGLDTLRFRTALDYYVEHPEDYLKIYSSVLDQLSAEQSTLGDSLFPALPATQDSTRQAYSSRGGH